MHIFLIKITMMQFSSVHSILVVVYDVTHDLICKPYECVYVIGENKVDYMYYMYSFVTVGQCALHYAASKDRYEIAELLLLANGAASTVGDWVNNSPLHWATSKGKTIHVPRVVSDPAWPNSK